MRRAVLALLLLAAPARSASLQTFLPETGLAQHIVATLDLGSFRSSLGPRREPGARHFADLGMKPSALRADRIVFEDSDWTITLFIENRGDANRDGIEDVTLCWSDAAKKGSYRVMQPLLLQQYDRNGPLVALAFTPEDIPGCPHKDD